MERADKPHNQRVQDNAAHDEIGDVAAFKQAGQVGKGGIRNHEHKSDDDTDAAFIMDAGGDSKHDKANQAVKPAEAAEFQAVQNTGRQSRGCADQRIDHGDENSGAESRRNHAVIFVHQPGQPVCTRIGGQDRGVWQFIHRYSPLCFFVPCGIQAFFLIIAENAAGREAFFPFYINPGGSAG